jgi:hypothetical protein
MTMNCFKHRHHRLSVVVVILLVAPSVVTAFSTSASLLRKWGRSSLKATVQPTEDYQESSMLPSQQRTAAGNKEAATSHLKSEIDELHKQAEQRLHELAVQLKEYEDFMASKKNDEITTTESHSSDRTLRLDAKSESRTAAAAAIKAAVPAMSRQEYLNALDDTHWKVVFDVGREPGSWMPTTWGASGHRVRIQLTVHLTDIPLTESMIKIPTETGDIKVPASDLMDDFLFHSRHINGKNAPIHAQGPESSSPGTGSTTSVPKVLRVVEAYTFPSGVGTDSHGRHRIQEMEGLFGAYRILIGQGPRGTDLLRYYVNVPNDVYSSSVVNESDDDVYLPSGRVYSTNGYFPVIGRSHERKEQCVAQYHAAAQKHDELVRAMQDGDLAHYFDTVHDRPHLKSTSSSIKSEPEGFSGILDRVKYEVRARLLLREYEEALAACANQLRDAREQDPEKSMLHIAHNGLVGITKEGCICRKVRLGPMTQEYHIVGTAEMAAVKKPCLSSIDSSPSSTTGPSAKLHP